MRAFALLLCLLAWMLVSCVSSFELPSFQKNDFYSLSMRRQQQQIGGHVGRMPPLPAQGDGEESTKPSLIVFDLDGCLWRPEMYELLWEGCGAGAPFEPIDSSRAKAKCGTVVELLGDVGHVLEELYMDPTWNGVQVGISSRTDEPTWAKELLQKFTLPNSEVPLETVFTGPWEIAYDSKTLHFERISATTGVPLDSMLFFDNESGNCRSVSRQGVSVCYCPNGVTREAFDQAIKSFPCTWGEVVGMDI